jgi:hypothetical protein
VTEREPHEQRPRENLEEAGRAGKAATSDLPPSPNFVPNRPEGPTPPDTQAEPATQAAPTASGGNN